MQDAATGAHALRSRGQGGRAFTAGGSGCTSVVVFGAGAFGQLGNGSEHEVIRPTLLPGLSALRVCAAACGDFHSAVVTADGEIFTFGIGEYGVLGHGNDERSVRPRRVDALVGEHVASVSCGWRHTACLTQNGGLFTWGHGGYGQLGHGGYIHFALPLRLQSPRLPGSCRRKSNSPSSWQQVSCGWRHTAALAEGGVASTWGDGEHLQLGHGDRLGQPRPRLLDAFTSDALRQLECGSHHTAAISSVGQLYTWGAGSFGQLGHGERRAEAVPRLVVGLAALEVTRVACGGHTCVLTAHGEMFTFGNGKHGQLGHGHCRVEASPRSVQALRDTRVLGIACGDFHSLALTADGCVYTWGAGGFGELGHGNLSHENKPRQLDALRHHSLVFAACGASHNLLLLNDAPGNETSSDEYDEDDDAASV